MEILLFIMGVFVGIVFLLDYQHTPKCNWCGGRHRGRCMFNPRAGKIFSNCNDGYFDWNNPNV